MPINKLRKTSNFENPSNINIKNQYLKVFQTLMDTGSICLIPQINAFVLTYFIANKYYVATKLIIEYNKKFLIVSITA